MIRGYASNGIMLALVAAFAAAALAVSPARQTTAEQQYQRAQALEAALEIQPKVSRTEADYERVIDSYHRVLLITPQAQFATPSLVAIGRLYEEMGQLIDPGYFRKAVDTYETLLRQYPRTRHGPEALYAMAKIERGPLGAAETADKNLRELIRRYPSSDQADQARLDLAGAAPARTGGRARPGQQAAQEGQGAGMMESAGNGQRGSLVPAPGSSEAAGPEGGEEGKQPARVGGIRTQEIGGRTRILIALDGPVKFRSARVAEPERAYFDLSRAYLPARMGNRLTLASDFVTSVHIAQNRPHVVRVVLDLRHNASYSISLLRHPYRLAIDVSSGPSDSETGETQEAGRDDAGANGAVETAGTGSRANASASPASSARNMPAGSRRYENETGKAGEAAGASPNVLAERPAENAPAGSRRYENAPPAAASRPSGADADTSTPSLPGISPAGSRRYEYGNGQPGSAAPAPPTRSGATSLTRELGLKIGRIVIDAGHGGFDTGTIGPTGLEEKDVCLDVAKRLGRLIQRQLPGASVVYTRDDDSFVPLETRTEIANERQADLFVSIHANSSSDSEARGIETYYLNFATSPDAMAVAARENALSQESVHQLQDLLKKISLNDKILESRELAGDIDQSLGRQLRLAHVQVRDRGVKKAPFVVLIGAHMPSILAEISFLSNPTDEHLLKSPRYRQRIAVGLFDGIKRYLASLNSLSYNEPKAAAPTQK